MTYTLSTNVICAVAHTTAYVLSDLQSVMCTAAVSSQSAACPPVYVQLVLNHLFFPVGLTLHIEQILLHPNFNVSLFNPLIFIGFY